MHYHLRTRLPYFNEGVTKGFHFTFFPPWFYFAGFSHKINDNNALFRSMCEFQFWQSCVLTKPSKSDLLHFFKNPYFVRKRDINVISYENEILTQYPLTLAISIVLVNSGWTFSKSTSFLLLFFFLVRDFNQVVSNKLLLY